MAAVSTAIYAIRNCSTGAMYIGSAVNCAKRWRKHQRELERGTHHSKPLQRAHDLYGRSAFEYSIIEYVDGLHRLIQREQVWMDFFKPQYNVARFAGSPSLGRRFSIETRAKMSAAHKGKKRPPRSAEWCKNISEARLGQKFTPKQREAFDRSRGPEVRALQAATLRETLRRKRQCLP